MSTWRDSLRTAKFRDVEFKVESAETPVGRRAVLHQAALKDLPYVEDMGRHARIFNVEAFLIGDDFLDQSGRLMDAIEKPGAGTLVHPYFGSAEVVCEYPATPRISATREGRIARFSLRFIEAGEARYPAAEDDPTAKLQTSAGSAAAAAVSFFSGVYDSSGPSFVVNQVLTDLNYGWATIKKYLGNLPGVNEAMAAVESVVSTGSALADAIDGALDGVADLGKSVDQIISVADEIGDDFDILPSTTATRVRQAANQRYLKELLKSRAIIEAVRAAAEVDLDSYQDAVRVRGLITDQIDELLAEAGDNGDDDLYIALQDLRSEVVTRMEDRGASLARVIERDPTPGALPALLVAYQEYEDLDREDEVIARNYIRHPGLGSGGATLELLDA